MYNATQAFILEHDMPSAGTLNCADRPLRRRIVEVHPDLWLDSGLDALQEL